MPLMPVLLDLLSRASHRLGLETIDRFPAGHPYARTRWDRRYFDIASDLKPEAIERTMCEAIANTPSVFAHIQNPTPAMQRTLLGVIDTSLRRSCGAPTNLVALLVEAYASPTRGKRGRACAPPSKRVLARTCASACMRPSPTRAPCRRPSTSSRRGTEFWRFEVARDMALAQAHEGRLDQPVEQPAGQHRQQQDQGDRERGLGAKARAGKKRRGERADAAVDQVERIRPQGQAGGAGNAQASEPGTPGQRGQDQESEAQRQ
ncbi:hypothetical protein [Massilia sp. Dwa41.01b]|uniref:hypothetical protein n=1 Tax=Massilia sp. Dwa41.01b TaxID=2709302 RepID=UPI001E5E27B8|nr:hypothetical protein [Massilia sp. Dwa41.01b]